MRRYLTIFGVSLLIVTLLLGLTGCKDQIGTLAPKTILPDLPGAENLTQEDVLARIDNTTPYDELITTEIDIDAFVDTFFPDPRVPDERVPLVDIAKKLPMECLRQKQNNLLYSIHKVKQGGLLYIFYPLFERTDVEEGMTFFNYNWFYVVKPLQLSDFSSIMRGEEFKTGISVKKVLKIDPAARPFIRRALMSKNETTGELVEHLETRHYLKDGALAFAFELDGDRYKLVSGGNDPRRKKFAYLCYGRPWSALNDPSEGNADLLPIDQM